MQVQGTNDSSIVSKLSSSTQGYFEDDCLKLFVAKKQRRSPIINRGYYIRFKAIEAVFKSWFSLMSSTSEFQIVSLGAGFDSSYFRLKSQNKLPKGCRYFEIDYKEVMCRKLNCIINSKFISSTPLPSHNQNIVYTSEDYVMIGQDLKNCGAVEKCFRDSGMNFASPTLFLSECAVTYMDIKSSNALIQWIQRNFQNSTFAAYEQVHPNDGFGIVMQNHFTSLQCPLKSVSNYPDEERQCSRYKELGWERCFSITMIDFFMSLSDEEKNRIQALELFDEYEMWHEKCHHYVLIWACQGICMSPPPDMFHKRGYSNGVLNSNINSTVNWKLEGIDPLLQRFGHQIVLISPHFLLTSGGFGEVKKKHQRLSGLVGFDLLTKMCFQASLSDPEELLDKRMYHSMTKLSNGDVVVMGGRSSPSKVYEKVVIVKPLHSFNLQEQLILPKQSQSCKNSLEEVSSCVEQKTIMPVPTWRHSASLVLIDGIESIVVFGGCKAQKETYESCITNDCYILNSATWNWTKVPCQEHTPSPRLSHSSVMFDQSKVAVTCGLSRNETILNSVHIFNSEISMWSIISIAGLLPRYSHTSHFWNNNILLVGGITCVSGFSLSVGIINLATMTAIECNAPAQDPEYPILLSNHCSYIYEDSIVISGGGGNCFSFGTHFNKKSITIEMDTLLNT